MEPRLCDMTVLELGHYPGCILDASERKADSKRKGGAVTRQAAASHRQAGQG